MFSLDETLAAAGRNYKSNIPQNLQDLSLERAELDRVRTLTGKAPGSYNLATKNNLCFDSAVLYLEALQGKFPDLRFAVSEGKDHAMLIMPLDARSVIVIDPSWKQFYAPFAAVNQKLFESLPEVLFLKDFSRVQKLMEALDVIFCHDHLTSPGFVPPSAYYKAYDLESPDCITQRLRAEKVLRAYKELKQSRASYSVASSGMAFGAGAGSAGMGAGAGGGEAMPKAETVRSPTA